MGIGTDAGAGRGDMTGVRRQSGGSLPLARLDLLGRDNDRADAILDAHASGNPGSRYPDVAGRRTRREFDVTMTTMAVETQV
jgi:hypothetical protein